ncbi:MAG: ATP-binding protein [Cucumibacter sp.]
MVPDIFRAHFIRAIAALFFVFLFAAPAAAQSMFGLSIGQLTLVIPYAIAVGAAVFAAISAWVAWRSRSRGEFAAQSARHQVSDMRASLDGIEALLSGMREVTLIWREGAAAPRIFGPVGLIVDGESTPTAMLEFQRWLTSDSAAMLTVALGDLKALGAEFDLMLNGPDHAQYRAAGRLAAGAPVLRITPVNGGAKPYPLPSAFIRRPDIVSCTALFACLNHPAWIRNARGALVFANGPYLELARALGLKPMNGELPELFGSAGPDRHRPGGEAHKSDSLTEELPRVGLLDLTLFALEDGSAGYAVQGSASNEAERDPSLSFLTAAINGLATAVAVFDGAGQLTHYNKAFVELWGIEPDWLDTKPNERAILDKLRTRGQLPPEPDYRRWRSEHLKSYGLPGPREAMWTLPNGQVLNVIASPAPKHRGVIYVYENRTERLALETKYNSLIVVQRETLNALSEAVAVFGTDGRLKLHNPQLSSLWKLPMNELGRNPHIDAIAEACGRALPGDGARIWEGLKRAIIDLGPDRRDESGRLQRTDGKLVDFAIVRLPDGQSMMTFVDVTQAAQYEMLLKERNEALETADKLKDAFVQNVSYELRSPLTNIIGFSELLAQQEIGTLNDKQREYTRYIRSSSETLGLLIDNILDLANVDAGIATLNVEELDVATLVDKARAGLAATLENTGGAPVNFIVEIEPGLPRFVADGSRMVQVLYNLLANSIRYSDAGTEVRLKVEGRGDRLLFVVEDEGVGIPEDLVASIFDRFEGISVEGRQRGAGLGLAIVKTFVHLHGGTISVERRAPRGTRVIVNLPACQQVLSAAG